MDQMPPMGWGKDELSKYLGMSYTNQFASFANKKDQYKELKSIDDCFFKIANNLNNTKAFLPALLLFRSHSAYRAACTLMLGTQITESFPVIRLCIETAAYALYINMNSQLGEVWMKRHDDADALKEVKNKFRHSSILKEIQGKDKKLAEIYDMLYNRTIDFGAHPNERSLTSNLSINEEEDKKTYTQDYFKGDGLYLDHGIKTLAQAGLCSLHIFQFIFIERFSLLGITESLQNIRVNL